MVNSNQSEEKSKDKKKGKNRKKKKTEKSNTQTSKQDSDELVIVIRSSRSFDGIPCILKTKEPLSRPKSTESLRTMSDELSREHGIKSPIQKNFSVKKSQGRKAKSLEKQKSSPNLPIEFSKPVTESFKSKETLVDRLAHPKSPSKILNQSKAKQLKLSKSLENLAPIKSKVKQPKASKSLENIQSDQLKVKQPKTSKSLENIKSSKSKIIDDTKKRKKKKKQETKKYESEVKLSSSPEKEEVPKEKPVSLKKFRKTPLGQRTSEAIKVMREILEKRKSAIEEEVVQENPKEQTEDQNQNQTANLEDPSQQTTEDQPVDAYNTNDSELVNSETISPSTSPPASPPELSTESLSETPLLEANPPQMLLQELQPSSLGASDNETKEHSENQGTLENGLTSDLSKIESFEEVIISDISEIKPKLEKAVVPADPGAPYTPPLTAMDIAGLKLPIFDNADYDPVLVTYPGFPEYDQLRSSEAMKSKENATNHSKVTETPTDQTKQEQDKEKPQEVTEKKKKEKVAKSKSADSLSMNPVDQNLLDDIPPLKDPYFDPSRSKFANPSKSRDSPAKVKSNEPKESKGSKNDKQNKST